MTPAGDGPFELVFQFARSPPCVRSYRFKLILVSTFGRLVLARRYQGADDCEWIRFDDLDPKLFSLLREQLKAKQHPDLICVEKSGQRLTPPEVIPAFLSYHFPTRL